MFGGLGWLGPKVWWGSRLVGVEGGGSEGFSGVWRWFS